MTSPAATALLKRVLAHRAFAVALLLVISFLVHRNWFQRDILLSGEVLHRPDDILKAYLWLPRLWQNVSVGRTAYIYLHRHFCFMLRGMMASAFPSSMRDLAALAVPMTVLPAVSMYWAASRLSRGDRVAAFFAALFFAFNTYILHISRGGQTYPTLAVAIAPLPVVLFIVAMDRGNLKYAFLGGLTLAVQVCAEVRFAYLTSLIALAYFPVRLALDWKKSRGASPGHSCGRSPWTQAARSFKMLAVFLLVPAVLHLYWIVPAVMQNNSLASPGSLGQPYWIYDHNPITLAKAVTVFHPWAALPSENVGEIELEDVRSLYWLLPVLVFLAPLLVRKRKVWFFACVAAVFVFLAKGAHWPFGGAYIWCFKHLPGFGGFRDPSKFFVGVTLAYAFLIGRSMSELCRRAASALPGRWARLTSVLPLAASIWLVYLVYPHWNDQLVGGTYLPRPMGEDHKQLRDAINTDRTDFRTLWHPFRGIYTFSSPDRPYLGAVTYHLFDMYLYREDANEDCLEQTTRWGKLIGLLNVKYVALPPLTAGEWVYDAFSTTREEHREKLLRQQDIVPGPVRWLLLNDSRLPHFYVAPSGAAVAGGLGALVGLAELSGDRQVFGDVALFFTDDLKEESAGVLDDTGTVIFYRQDTYDLALGLTEPGLRIELWDHAVYAGDNDRETAFFERTVLPPHGDMGWKKGEIAHTSDGMVDFADPSKDHRMEVTFTVESEDAYEIWIRLGFSPGNGTLEFTLDGEEVARRKTTAREDHYRWMKAGERVLPAGDHLLAIRSRADGKQQLDQVVILSSQQRQRQEAMVLRLLEDKTVLFLSSPSTPGGQWRLYEKPGEPVSLDEHFIDGVSPPVNWTRETPTRYTISYAQDQPGYLVFSESFDPGWILRLKGRGIVRPQKAYGRTNAFRVEKTGEIRGILEYRPQRYVNIGLAMTASIAVLASGCVIRSRIRDRRRSPTRQ